MGDRIGVQIPLREIYLSLTNHPGQLSLAIPPWVGVMSTGQRAVMRLRGRAIQIDVYFALLYFTITSVQTFVLLFTVVSLSKASWMLLSYVAV